jgi:hypothetical protein
MSNYFALTFHPVKNKWINASWMDNHFGSHHYGVKFVGESKVYDPRIVDLKTSPDHITKALQKIEVLPPALDDQQWFQELVENLQNLLTEGEFAANWTRIQAYHTAGAAIVENENKAPNIIEETAKALGRSKRSVYQYVQFYKLVPDLKKLKPEDGKAISWHKVVNELLPEHGAKKKAISKDNLIAQFIKDIFPGDRRKKFIKEVVEEWEAYEP